MAQHQQRKHWGFESAIGNRIEHRWCKQIAQKVGKNNRVKTKSTV